MCSWGASVSTLGSRRPGSKPQVCTNYLRDLRGWQLLRGLCVLAYIPGTVGWLGHRCQHHVAISSSWKGFMSVRCLARICSRLPESRLGSDAPHSSPWLLSFFLFLWKEFRLWLIVTSLLIISALLVSSYNTVLSLSARVSLVCNQGSYPVYLIIFIFWNNLGHILANAFISSHLRMGCQFAVSIIWWCLCICLSAASTIWMFGYFSGFPSLTILVPP